MEDLKTLLDLSKIDSEEHLQKRFLEIAKLLMCGYVIKKGEERIERYAIVEIEFYLYTNYHRDYITYPRKLKAGRWFFHPSGVDLTFESVGIDIERKGPDNKVTYKLLDNPCFGGILIRGIYNLDNRIKPKEQRYIFGPQKCVDVLWQDLDAFGATSKDYPVLEKAEEALPNNICQCKRHINIKKDQEDNKAKEWPARLGLPPVSYKNDIETYLERPYRFFGEDPCNFSKIPSAVRPKKVELIPPV